MENTKESKHDEETKKNDFNSFFGNCADFFKNKSDKNSSDIPECCKGKNKDGCC